MRPSTIVKPDSMEIVGLIPEFYNLIIEALQCLVANNAAFENTDFDKETLIEAIKFSNQLLGLPTDTVTEENLPEIMSEFAGKRMQASYIIKYLTTPNVNLN